MGARVLGAEELQGQAPQQDPHPHWDSDLEEGPWRAKGAVCNCSDRVGMSSHCCPLCSPSPSGGRGSAAVQLRFCPWWQRPHHAPLQGRARWEKDRTFRQTALQMDHSTHLGGRVPRISVVWLQPPYCRVGF